jgi:hypothetical protein
MSSRTIFLLPATVTAFLMLASTGCESTGGGTTRVSSTYYYGSGWNDPYYYRRDYYYGTVVVPPGHREADRHSYRRAPVRVPDDKGKTGFTGHPGRVFLDRRRPR